MFTSNILPQKSPNTAKLTAQELKELLIGFAPQQKRVIQGIHDNQGILTHEAFSKFYANNISHVAKNVNTRLMNQGLIILCFEPAKPNPLTKSHNWYLCRLELEIISHDQEAAND